jgi:hypothetical protein
MPTIAEHFSTITQLKRGLETGVLKGDHMESPYRMDYMRRMQLARLMSFLGRPGKAHSLFPHSHPQETCRYRARPPKPRSGKTEVLIPRKTLGGLTRILVRGSLQT